jgi:hypothetical protein
MDRKTVFASIKFLMAHKLIRKESSPTRGKTVNYYLTASSDWIAVQKPEKKTRGVPNLVHPPIPNLVQAPIPNLVHPPIPDQVHPPIPNLVHEGTPIEGTPRKELENFSLSESKNLELPDQNLEIPDLDKNQNPIPDQQEDLTGKLEAFDPRSVSSAAAPIFAPHPPENTPLSRGGALWDINYLNEIWNGNKAGKWKVSSLMFLSAEIQYGLEQFLLKAGGDRTKAYRLIEISIAEMANDDFYGSRSRMFNEVIAIDPSKPCKTYCGNWLGAAIEREEKAKSALAKLTSAPIVPADPFVPSHFSGWMDT